ncbi:MAG: ABC transporter permease [Chelatococcus sp.]|jgi:ABC-type nitrate/sulfonate/bicarbonate transport system permease component|uniref:ABC transporter permease n=1 Tax=unclassified Chelatococcus TaxID=2638111 RepID=UPI001BCAA2C4|nr:MULTISPECIES: ABC transporter permease [unclassified Chelatococcus]CAH1648623.1 NitT/TauT family transport system permease protein [Hyphomicrobiales bacterium]MBS7741897.1 ABC transporter permease [Chelatococcus sp. HY11]MBX3538192.1 ABC transporter permease [Chelatococcus sp.]MBX3541305.1 ABC transporter permease [Chelatococcus sp.]MCO5074802.1 ABC transporter permease [Chelatococcus sp.]
MNQSQSAAANVANAAPRTSSFARLAEFRQVAIAIAAVLGGLIIWQILSSNISPLFLPSPSDTWAAAIELAEDGTLAKSIVASLARIGSGWALGIIIGVPLGILMGHFRIIREMLEPYIEFFRFVPPIAFITLAVIWLGPGEESKVALIFYATVFIIVVNMIAGVQAVSELRLRAAASLGASPLRTLLTVVVPSTVPFMITGARLAMGNSFLTVVSAEIVAAQDGLGALIWTARNYGRTEWVFVGIIILGLLGYTCDRLLRIFARTFLKRYSVTV